MISLGEMVPLPLGTLPLPARTRLEVAARTGLPGSKDRRIAIERAYDWIDRNYPSYVKDK